MGVLMKLSTPNDIFAKQEKIKKELIKKKITEAEVEKFTEEILATRKALRQVRHNLKKDIKGLRNRLSFLNIALVPILVTVAAGGLGAARMRRRRRAVGVTE